MDGRRMKLKYLTHTGTCTCVPVSVGRDVIIKHVPIFMDCTKVQLSLTIKLKVLI
jgi:hypothetical protein